MKNNTKNLNILIAGYPRSGNTFLGYLLSYYFNAHYYDMYVWPKVVRQELPIEAMLIDPQTFSGNLDRPNQKNQVSSILKTHSVAENLVRDHAFSLEQVNYDPKHPLILVTREPKDVAVSYFYYSFFRLPFKNGKWKAKYLPYSLRYWYYKKFNFPSFALRIAKEWSDFTLSWMTQKPHVINYESLKENPILEIQKITERFNLEFNKNLAEESANFCSFESMKKLEKTKIHYGQSHNNIMKTRSGESGEWKSLFKPELVLQFDEITAEARQVQEKATKGELSCGKL